MTSNELQAEGSEWKESDWKTGKKRYSVDTAKTIAISVNPLS